MDLAPRADVLFFFIVICLLIMIWVMYAVRYPNGKLSSAYSAFSLWNTAPNSQAMSARGLNPILMTQDANTSSLSEDSTPGTLVHFFNDATYGEGIKFFAPVGQAMWLRGTFSMTLAFEVTSTLPVGATSMPVGMGVALINLADPQLTFKNLAQQVDVFPDSAGAIGSYGQTFFVKIEPGSGPYLFVPVINTALSAPPNLTGNVVTYSIGMSLTAIA